MALSRFFNNLKIAQKITVIIAIAALITGIFSGSAASWVSSSHIMQKQESDLKNTLHEASKLINNYFVNLKNDIQQAANSNITAKAIQDFDIAWSQLEKPQKYLQQTYINNNPHPVGEKDKLNSANDGSLYSDIHRQYHNMFSAQKDAKGYYDIFLFNKNGDLVYSVYKELDYATNMNSGKWRNSGLGQIFQKIAKNPSQGTIAYDDFKPYAPSSDAPAAFIASPVYNAQQQFVGVIAYQMPIDRFSQLFHMTDKNYSMYIVGNDGTLRNDLYRTKENDIGATQAKIQNINDMHGRFLTDMPGLIFEKSLYMIDEISFQGTIWTAVIEHNQKLIDTIIWNTKFYSLLAALFGSSIVAVLGYLYARSFARPIVKLSETVDKLANGYDVDIPCKNNTDELGILARSLTTIHTQAQASARIKAAVDGADAMFMIADEDLKIIYSNNKVQNALLQSEGHFKQAMPNINLNKIIGTNLLDFYGDKNNHIKNILSSLHEPHATKLDFDNRNFNLVITPVYDQSGNRIGFVTEWSETTAQVKAAQAAELRNVQEQEIETQVAEVIQAAANGNFKERLNVNDDRQSIVTISNGINKICETVENFFNDLNHTVNGFADGDLTQSLQGNYSGDFNGVKESLNKSFATLRGTIQEISTVGNAIRTSSADITTGADDLSGRTEAQAASIEETVATMEEMSASVRNNANSAIQVTSLAQETLQQAESGRNVVAQAVTAMNQIETSARRITEIVSVIDSIASQTNLLALNAAVEAARAGEAGKGFAVVASEVRTLASRCSEAARDIRGLITGSNAQVIDGVKLVSATGTALSDIVASVTNVTTTISAISQASREQATGIEEISGAISQMDEITQQNAGLADNSAANARELSKEAEALSDLVRSFKTETGGSVLTTINKQLRNERPQSPKEATPSKPKTQISELSFENFSDFGTASGDDWADL
ncbi:MAG: methyl-accepting chemotaxis protein [Alphaproteobacteria bacterium]|jgi:methyl-accepting chemotaxis protein